MPDGAGVGTGFGGGNSGQQQLYGPRRSGFSVATRGDRLRRPCDRTVFSVATRGDRLRRPCDRTVFSGGDAATGSAGLAVATKLLIHDSHPGVIVTLDGEVYPPGTPLLFADDLAAVRGDGVFETLLVRDGGACLVEAHLGRLVTRPNSSSCPSRTLLPGGAPSSWQHGSGPATSTTRPRCVWSTAAAGKAARRPPHSDGEPGCRSRS